jgi:G:T/U-mismatch repair DNA glycosylase
MIVKKVVAKKGTGSFGGLSDYLLDKNNLHKGEKVEFVDFSNCPYTDQEKNLSFIKKMQDLNQRTNSDKTMHLVISFTEGEKPGRETLQNIEEELLKSIGMQDHHRMSVTHVNTNNFHLHIAVNRLDPLTHNLIDPYRDIPKLQKKAEELEEKHNLKKDNHTPNWQLEKDGIKDPTEQQNPKIKDQEIHSGMNSLLSWIKEEALEDIQAVIKDPNASLEDLHKTLADYNLELKPRGNGIVIADKKRNLFIKASDIHRDLSKGKLEKRFGEFKASHITTTPKKKFGKPVNEYWKKYQELSQSKRETKKEELRLEKLSRETLKAGITKKYAEQIQKVQLNPLMNKRDKAGVRKKIYEARSKELKALQVTFAEKRKEIYSRTNQTSFKEYLMELALQGDEKALKELRKQKQEIKPHDNVVMHPDKKESHSIFKTMIDKITKQGNVVYKLSTNSKLIDKGDHLKITIDKDEEAMLKALKMAMAKYGSTLNVQGNLEFKKRVLLVSQKYDLKVNFTDPQMKKILDQHQKQSQTQPTKKGMSR